MTQAIAVAIDIDTRERTAIQRLLHRYLPGVEIWAYGSRVRWNARPQSDLDLVAFAPPEQRGAVSQLREAFEESSLPFPVDLLIWDDLPESFHRNIEAEYVILQSTNKRDVPREWLQCTLADVCHEINYGLTASATQAPNGPKFLRITDIVAGQPDWDTVPFVSADEPTSEKYRLYDGDIVIARTGASTGTSSYIKNPPFAVFASYLVRLRIKPELDPRFVSYYLKSDQFREFMRGVLGDKSAQPNASASTMASAPFRAPKDLEEQRAIAHILGTLDDKIELNRRMNQTLEEMARAIFQDWFVDFGPVRAKLEGRQPYLPPELWDLFPDRLVDSELGEVPEGWGVKALQDCFDLTMGQSPPGSTYNEDGEGLPFFQGSTDFGFRFPENRKYCTAPTRIAHPNDTLVSVRAPVGALNMAWEKCCIGRGVAALRHQSGSSAFTYYSAWAIQSELQQYEQTGTVFGAITRKQFETLPVISPAPHLVTGFETYVLPLEQRIRGNVAEARALTSQRDALLPKLVSGELLPEGN